MRSKSNDKTTRVIVFNVAVYVTVPLSDDPDSPDYPTLEGATSAEYKRESIEKPLLACLRRFEWPCDAEVMDFTVEDE